MAESVVTSSPAARVVEDLGDLREAAGKLPPGLADLAAIDGVLAYLDGRRRDVPATPMSPLAVPRLDEQARIAPIEDLDTLIDAFSRVLEKGATGDEAERVVASLSRLAAVRPPDFPARTAPLRQRALGLLPSGGGAGLPSPFMGVDPEADLAGVVVAWTGGGVPGGQLGPRVGIYGFLSERLRKLATRVAERIPGQLLSEPTHRGGWIDARVVPGRLAGSAPVDPFDQALCLLRLAPDARGEALDAAAGVGGEFGRALRYALGGSEAVGDTAALWVAAARSRSPGATDAALDARHPGLGPDGAIAVSYGFEVKRVKPAWRGEARDEVRVSFQPALPVPERLDLPSVLFHARHRHLLASGFGSSWAATLWPLGRDAYLASQVNDMSWALESQGSYWQGDWEPLFDADASPSPVARMLVMLGCCARHSGASGLSRDALAAMIADGRLDGDGLGETLGILIGSDAVTHSRWLGAFREVGRISALHRHVLRLGVEQAAASLPGVPAARVVACLELLHEWTVEAGEPIRHAPTRDRLTSEGGKGRAAQLARSLLALAGDGSPANRLDVGAAALRARLERAERYAARAVGAP